MNSDPSDPRKSSPAQWHIVPEGENKCIWMNAGIVEYKLCDRNFECENCPLDSDLRLPPPLERKKLKTKKADVVQIDLTTDENIPLQRLFQNYTSYLIPHNIAYTLHHTWLRKNSDQEYICGIDDFFARLLPHRYSIVVPTINNPVKEGDSICWIQTNGMTLPIHSPIDGLVTDVNFSLVQNPHYIVQFPYDTGWIIKLQPAHSQKDSGKFLSPEMIQEKIKSDTEKFINRLRFMTKDCSTILGPLMNDGGSPVRSIEELFGLQKYMTIIKSILI